MSASCATSRIRSRSDSERRSHASVMLSPSMYSIIRYARPSCAKPAEMSVAIPLPAARASASHSRRKRSMATVPPQPASSTFTATDLRTCECKCASQTVANAPRPISRSTVSPGTLGKIPGSVASTGAKSAELGGSVRETSFGRFSPFVKLAAHLHSRRVPRALRSAWQVRSAMRKALVRRSRVLRA